MAIEKSIKRTHPVAVPLNEEEFAIIDREARKMGLKNGAYIRFALFNQLGLGEQLNIGEKL